MNNLYHNFIVSFGVLIKFFLLDPLYVKCSDQFVPIFFKIATNKSGVESRNSESGLLFCVYYSPTLQGR